jgi:hydroxyacylglutathione hydrolase
MSSLQIEMFPCLADNYGFLLHDGTARVTAAVDTPEVAAIEAALERRGWQLTHIFNTHHHMDHAGGNRRLKELTGCQIIGPGHDAARIPGIDTQVRGGDVFRFGTHRVEVVETPGHTRGHIVYRFPDDGVAFVGDTLFAMGCGRLFEGSPEQMWSSLQKIAAWPDETLIYCAHEYTAANGRFALTIEPGNPRLLQRMREVEKRRSEGLPTVPTTLALEKATNPFLRPASAELRRMLGLEGSEDVAVFARTRALKDAF